MKMENRPGMAAACHDVANAHARHGGLTDGRRRKRQAAILRTSRKLHKTLGACLFAFFLVLASTGLLLGWKKHSGGTLLPNSHQGTSTDMRDWLPISVLHQRANEIALESIDPELSLKLERIDIRPDKGMVKFVYLADYWGIQLDCTTGTLLQIERRRSDLIENIHDGSILDHIWGTDGEPIKLVYTSMVGLALLGFTITGLWLWIGPKRMVAASMAQRMHSNVKVGNLRLTHGTDAPKRS